MRRLWGLCLLLAAPSAAQVTRPDCLIQLTATAAASSGNFDNRSVNCLVWWVDVQFRGFSTASVELDSAPDNNGTPGAFAAFGGTVLSGTNPQTSFTQNSSQASMSGFFPWLKLKLNSVTGSGSITITAFGFRPNFTSVQPANVNQVGGNTVFACTSQALFNLSGSGNTQIIAGVASQNIRICKLIFAMASAIDMKLTEGTGSNCASGTADVTGLFKNSVSFGFDFDVWSPLLATKNAAGDAVCINSSGTVDGGGIVIYDQH